MKSTLLLLFAVLFIACQKEDPIEPTGGDRQQIGTWTIVPTGNPTDSFSFKLWTSETGVYDVIKKGIVSDGAVTISLLSGMFYDISYRDTALIGIHYVIENEGTLQADTLSVDYYWHQTLHRSAGYSPVNFTDTIPATIY